MDERAARVAVKSRATFYFVLFINFVIAVQLIPMIAEFSMRWTGREFVQNLLGYLGAYIVMAYVLPPITFSIAEALVEDRD